MSKARLKKLQIQSFRSFVNTEVEFPETGLVLIRGENPETGDPSGSGKSSLLLAIAYVLDILPEGFSASELPSWHSQDPMQVVLTLDIDGKEYVFARGKKNYIKGEDDEKPTTGAAAIAERQAALLGFQPAIVGALTYRAQSTPGLFLSQSPADKSEFLTSVLDLGTIEEAVDKAERTVSVIETTLANITTSFEVAKAELESLSRPKVDIPDIERTKTLVTEWEGRLAIHETHLREEEVALAEGLRTEQRQQEIVAAEVKLEQSRKFLSELRSVDNAGASEMERQREILRTNIRNYDTAIAKFVHQLDERKRYESELALVSNETCPTCEREWVGTGALEKVEDLQIKIDRMVREAEGKPVFERLRMEAETKLNALVFRANPNIDKLATIEKTLVGDIATLKASRDSGTVAKLRAAVESEKGKISQLKNMGVELKANLKIAENQRDTANAIFQQYERQSKGINERILKLQADIEKYSAMIGLEKDFVAMMGREGFLGIIFDDVLREIADEANARLGRLANVSHVSLNFVSESTTQKGKVKKQIQATVNVGGRATKYKTGLSGGMLTSVEQVVDLGVMTVISRRAGRTLGWLCLDEIFNGQGAMTKESALEVLQEFARDRLVLVIDHGTEFKEAFTKTITVEQVGGISTIKS